ncbi:MAG TPA: bifunctional 4-hydroxy-2-oxoglutarate aldolase/2-dehydro-3-deoxy-phosphogluconate aldolase [Alicycliphilus sp.]|nr:bifunctional 4-hydroxy-2-oxoglutarate aldolase/2-dehydro-3-deoxy-phosphogluconate aldolase [Alicycliphilus sp.]
MTQPVLDLIARARIVAIVRLPAIDDAIALSRALLDGGVRVFEFTLTTPGATEAIAQVAHRLPEVAAGEAAVGVGSVLSPEDAHSAIDAGASFVVSPVFKPDVVDVCALRETPIFPGAYTPTEIEAAWTAGAAAVKVFPSRGLGPGYIKDLREPMPFLKLMPTGGIDASNIAAYLNAGAVAVGVGSALVDRDIVARRDWAALTARARALVAACPAA